MVDPILQLEQVTKQFAGSMIPAVKEITFSLAQGDILGLLGSSGCGKTTLLRLIAGFEDLQGGSILLHQREIARPGYILPPEQRNLGMVFQDYALFPHLTVAKNIGFGLGKLSARDTQLRVGESIELVGLTGLEHRYPHELSGGQQQRVALARALAPRPDLILLDEPLSNLDVQVRLRLRQEIRSILKETGIAAIFVTHDQEEALSLCDRIVVMQAGKLEQIGTPQEVYSQPNSRFVADFVTQGNFLPAQIVGNVVQTEIGDFEIPLDVSLNKLGQGSDRPVTNPEINPATNLANHSSSSLEVMLRQEDLRLQPSNGEAAMGEVMIKDRQFLGREYIYLLRTKTGKTLQARTSKEVDLEIGTPVKVLVNPTQLRFFGI